MSWLACCIGPVCPQVTSYGLGGLCEDHNDPYGYNEGVKLTAERQNLVHSGDIFGTGQGGALSTAEVRIKRCMIGRLGRHRKNLLRVG